MNRSREDFINNATDEGLSRGKGEVTGGEHWDWIKLITDIAPAATSNRLSVSW